MKQVGFGPSYDHGHDQQAPSPTHCCHHHTPTPTPHLPACLPLVFSASLRKQELLLNTVAQRNFSPSPETSWPCNLIGLFACSHSASIFIISRTIHMRRAGVETPRINLHSDFAIEPLAAISHLTAISTAASCLSPKAAWRTCVARSSSAAGVSNPIASPQDISRRAVSKPSIPWYNR